MHFFVKHSKQFTVASLFAGKKIFLIRCGGRGNIDRNGHYIPLYLFLGHRLVLSNQCKKWISTDGVDKINTVSEVNDQFINILCCRYRISGYQGTVKQWSSFVYLSLYNQLCQAKNMCTKPILNIQIMYRVGSNEKCNYNLQTEFQDRYFVGRFYKDPSATTSLFV